MTVATLAEKGEREPGHAVSTMGWEPLAICLNVMGKEKGSFLMVWVSQTWATVQVTRLEFARGKEHVVTSGHTEEYYSLFELGSANTAWKKPD